LQQVASHYERTPINPKGLLAQLALLFKFVASFGVVSVMSLAAVLNAALPAVALSNPDAKNAAIKIVLECQKLTGEVNESHLKNLNEKTR
jgi:hypothetical protein